MDAKRFRAWKRLSAIGAAAAFALPMGSAVANPDNAATATQATSTCSVTVDIAPRNAYDDRASWPTTGVQVQLAFADGAKLTAVTAAESQSSGEVHGVAKFAKLPCTSTTISFLNTTSFHTSKVTLPVADPVTKDSVYDVVFHPKPKTDQAQTPGSQQPKPTQPSVKPEKPNWVDDLAKTGAGLGAIAVLGVLLTVMGIVPLVKRRRSEEQ